MQWAEVGRQSKQWASRSARRSDRLPFTKALVERVPYMAAAIMFDSRVSAAPLPMSSGCVESMIAAV